MRIGPRLAAHEAVATNAVEWVDYGEESEPSQCGDRWSWYGTVVLEFVNVAARGSSYGMVVM